MTKRVVLIVGGAVAALLIVVAILLVVVLNQMRADAKQDSYEDCMARQGFAVDDPAPAIADDDELNAYIEALAAAAQFCDR